MTGHRLRRTILLLLAALSGAAAGAAERTKPLPVSTAGSSTADSLAEVAERLYNAGDYEAARRHYERHIEFLRTRPSEDHTDLVESMVWLSATHWKMGRHVRGEQVARQALDLAKRQHGENHPQVGQALNMIGLCCMAQGRFAASDSAYRAALALFREQVGDESEEVAMCLNNLGALAGEQSEWIRADALYRACLQLNRRLHGSDNLRVARSMHNIGFAALARGHVLEARHFLELALDLRRRFLPADHPDVALTLQTLARTYQREDPEEACGLFEEVLELRRRTLGERHPHVAWSLRDLGYWCSLARGDHALAIAQLREALAIYEQTDEAIEHARTLDALAGVKARQGEFAVAESLLVQAAQKGLGSIGRARSTILQSLATFRCMEGRYAEAESLLLVATDAFEAVRLPYSETQARLFIPFTSPYPLLAATYLWQGQPQRAWPAVERSRARGLLDNLLSAEGSGASRVRSLTEIQAALAPHEAIVGWLDLSQFTKLVGSWVYVIRDQGPVRWSPLTHASIPAEDVHGKRRLIGDRAARFRTTLRYAAAWATRVTDVTRVTRDANALWRERLAPAAEHLTGVERMIVIPSEMMDGVPIEALVDDDGVAVAERFEVSYAPSATVHCWLAGQRDAGSTAIERALLVGDPAFSPEHLDRPPDLAMAPVVDATVLRSALARDREALAALPPLPHSSAEVRAIASTLTDPAVLLGRAASEESIARLLDSGELRRYDAIHFATHAIIDATYPELSALILSQVDLPNALDFGDEHETMDGLITVDEVLGSWDLDAELVTLSGCQTALGRRVPGEGYLGFAQAFLHAGARSVVLSLWDVDDTATSMLMTRFYENLTGQHDGGRPGKQMTKAAALRDAKQWLRDQEVGGVRPFAHPAYWASFILIGDSE